jgi:hypothetical protein
MAITGKRGTYNQAAATVKVDMEDAVDLLPVEDLPLSLRLKSEPAKSYKFEHMDEDLDLGNVTATATSALASTTITVADTSGVRVRDVFRRRGGNLLVEVASITDATHFVVAARPGLGSTDEAIASADVLELIGQVPVEGEDPQAARMLDPVGRFNYTQIFMELVEATRTVRAIDKYGDRDPIQHEQLKKFREAAIRWEKSILLGKRYKSGDNKQRFTGGLLETIATNTVLDATVATLEAKFKTLLRKAWLDSGASPRLFVVSASLQDAFNALQTSGTNKSLIIERSDRTAGNLVKVYDSMFGPIELLMDRYMPAQYGALVQEEYLKQKVLTGWEYQPLAKTGDSDRGMVVSERGLMVKNEKAHGLLKVTDLV